MTVNEIQNNIIYNENLIYQFNYEKREIEAQINELEQLREKFSTLQTNFGAKQEDRKRGLQHFSVSAISNKIFSSYFNGMTSLLNGYQFNDAYEGLSTAKQRINIKLNELIQNLSDCEDKITYRENRKIYWQEQLRVALTKVED